MPRIKAATLEKHHLEVWESITASLSTLLNERNYDTITLAHIAEGAGIARNTLYRYASDKTALMLAIAWRVGAPTVKAIVIIASEKRSASSRVDDIVATLLHAFADSTVRLMLQPMLLTGLTPNDPENLEGPFKDIALAMERVIRDGVRDREFTVVANEQLTAWLLSGVIRSATDRLGRDGLSADDLVPTVQHLVVSALIGGRTVPPSVPNK